MGIIETKIIEGAQGPRLKVYRGDYDFAVDGGAVGAINLIGQAVIPAGTVIIGGFVNVQTQCTSGGAATIALAVEAAGDVVPSSVAIGAWTVGVKQVKAGDTAGAALAASVSIVPTAARDIVMTIAVAALTAGKFQVVLYALDPLA